MKERISRSLRMSVFPTAVAHSSEIQKLNSSRQWQISDIWSWKQLMATFADIWASSRTDTDGEEVFQRRESGEFHMLSILLSSFSRHWGYTWHTGVRSIQIPKSRDPWISDRNTIVPFSRVARAINIFRIEIFC